MKTRETCESVSPSAWTFSGQLPRLDCASRQAYYRAIETGSGSRREAKQKWDSPSDAKQD